MNASYTSTTSSTYTVADVEVVMRSVRADLMMIAASTKAIPEKKAQEYAHDIELLAKNGYLVSADVTLLSAYGDEVKAAKYHFQTGDEATGAARPGGVRWPETPNGDIRIILKPTDAFGEESDKVAKLPLKISWGTTSTDTSHGELSSSGERGYSSNGFGANRKDYS